MNFKYINLYIYKKVAAFFFAFLLLGSAYPAGAQNVTVNSGTTYQTISGFGAASVWCESKISAAIASVIWTDDSSLAPGSQVNGHVGLSILRIIIDDGGSGNWGTAINSAKQALAINSNMRVFASEWSPPASMKNNGKAAGNNTGNDNFNPGSNTNQINASNYSAYATFQTSFMASCKTAGFTPYALSVQNEPDYDTSYQSCLWSAAQFDTYIGTYLGPALNTAGYNPIIMMPESFADNLTGSSTTMGDANAAKYVKVIGAHFYGGGPNTIPASYSTTAGHTVESWETEMSDFAASDNSIASGLKYANQVHSSIVDHNFNAYNYWWIYSLNTDNEGLYDSTGNPSKRLYTLGNFSKFIRPGFTRVSCTEVPSAGVSVSAYYSSTAGKVVVVAINNNGSAQNLNVNLGALSATTVYPWVTSSSLSLVQQTGVAVSGGSFTYSLPSQSVVSFVASVSGSSGPTATPTKTSTPIVASTWRVNAGGPAYTDGAGHVWAADENYSGGSTVASGGTITGTSDSTLYDTQRYGSSFSYSFNVPAGSYQVTLKFAETYSGDFSTGARIFSVSLNGTTVTPNLDIYSQVGSNAADDQVYNNVSPSGGVITIQLTAGSGTDLNAVLEALQIIPMPVTSTATFTPTRTSTNSPTRTPSATATRTPTPTSTNTIANTATKTATNSPTRTPTATATRTPSNTPTNSPSVTPSRTPTNSATATPTSTNTVGNTVTSTFTRTATNTATATLTATPSSTASRTASATPSLTPTRTPSNTPTATAMNTNTQTPTNTGTAQPTNTATNSPTATSTRTATHTATNSPSATPSRTPTATATNTVPAPTNTATNSPTNTLTRTPSNTPTSTAMNTNTQTPTNTGTAQPTNTPTNSPTKTPSPTATNSPTKTPTNTLTATPSNTPSNSATKTPTNTPSNSPTNTPVSTLTPTPTSVTVSMGNGGAPPSSVTELPGTSNVPVLQFELNNPGTSPVNLTSLTLKASGSGNDGSGINLVKLYVDSNGNGVVDGGDTLLQTTTYSGNEGTATFNFTDNIPANGNRTYLVEDNFSGTANGTFQAGIENVTDLSGTNGTGTVNFSGAPLNGAVITLSAATATVTKTNTPTVTPVNTDTPTNTNTFTPTKTNTPTSTNTPTFTNTSTITPTSSSTPSFTATSTSTSVPKGKPTPIIFPNPAPGPTVGILPPPYVGIGDVNVKIFTVAFRKVQDTTYPSVPSGTAVQLNLTDKWGSPLASGLYYAVVTTNAGRSIGKLLIQR